MTQNLLRVRSLSRLRSTSRLSSLVRPTRSGAGGSSIAKNKNATSTAASIVEVDLLRDGPFVLAIDWRHVPVPCRGPYRCCVRRALVPNRVEMFPMPLREALPLIPIPLRSFDRDVALELQR